MEEQEEEEEVDVQVEGQVGGGLAGLPRLRTHFSHPPAKSHHTIAVKPIANNN